MITPWDRLIYSCSVNFTLEVEELCNRAILLWNMDGKLAFSSIFVDVVLAIIYMDVATAQNSSSPASLSLPWLDSSGR